MRRVNEKPNDIKGWLEYLHAQEVSVYFSKPLQRLEKQLSIVEAALKHNPSNELLQSVSYTHLTLPTKRIV